jgi:hypothetical protein
LEVIGAKTSAAVAQFLVNAWQAIGLPHALYLDNDVVWRGSGSAARTFSHIVRLCLLLGVQLVFTPPYTPQANPLIESFNRVWDRNFWQRTTFHDLEQLRRELDYFQHYYRHRQVWAEFDQHSAAQHFADFAASLLAADFTQHHQLPLPLTAGHLHFIRFVSEQGTFSLLNETWQLEPGTWAGKTIRATLDTEQQQLAVYHQTQRIAVPQLIATFSYPLLAPVLPLAAEFQRPALALWPASCFDC